jgi:hypothetical protein
MTEGDKIRSMNDIQLAVYLTKVQMETLNMVREKLGIGRLKFPDSAVSFTEAQWMEFLKQEAEE